MNNSPKILLTATSLILIALAERLWFDLGPNAELVTWACVLAGMYLPQKYRLIVPMMIMVMSDLILGLSSISLFTWTAFIGVAFLPKLMSKVTKLKVVQGSASGVVGVAIFFLWTNFGVWLVEPGGMYPNTAPGLLQAYINALPFLKMQLTSAVLFIPVTILFIEELSLWSSEVNNLVRSL